MANRKAVSCSSSLSLKIPPILKILGRPDVRGTKGVNKQMQMMMKEGKNERQKIMIRLQRRLFSCQSMFTVGGGDDYSDEKRKWFILLIPKQTKCNKERSLVMMRSSL